VVQMGMRQKNSSNLARGDWERCSVAQPKLFVALEQPAIYQHAFFAMAHQILGARDRAGTAQKCDVDSHTTQNRRCTNSMPQTSASGLRDSHDVFGMLKKSGRIAYEHAYQH